jgi:excisionase family DNA binding protein
MSPTTTDQTDPELSLTEAGAMAGLSEISVRRRVRAGRLPAVRVGRRILVRRSDVEQVLLAREPVAAGSGK